MRDSMNFTAPTKKALGPARFVKGCSVRLSSHRAESGITAPTFGNNHG